MLSMSMALSSIFSACSRWRRCEGCGAAGGRALKEATRPPPPRYSPRVLARSSSGPRPRSAAIAHAQHRPFLQRAPAWRVVCGVRCPRLKRPQNGGGRADGVPALTSLRWFPICHSYSSDLRSHSSSKSSSVTKTETSHVVPKRILAASFLPPAALACERQAGCTCPAGAKPGGLVQCTVRAPVHRNASPRGPVKVKAAVCWVLSPDRHQLTKIIAQ